MIFIGRRVLLATDLDEQLYRSQAVTEGCQAVAERVAVVAADRAPKATGAGAASIHQERVEDGPGGLPRWRVSWDPEYFYMRFHELGTVYHPALGFLRGAAEEVSEGS